MDEIWKDVVGYEGHYQVSDLGRVKRVRACNSTYAGRIIKQNKKRHGYMYVGLSKRGAVKYMSVHRLVMLAFETENQKPQVNHINGVTGDNRLANLEWMTASENIRHAHEVLGHAYGTPPVHYGENHPQSKLTRLEVEEIRRLYSTGENPSRKLAKLYDVSKTTILVIVNNKGWL